MFSIYLGDYNENELMEPDATTILKEVEEWEDVVLFCEGFKQLNTLNEQDIYIAHENVLYNYNRMVSEEQ